MPGRNRSEPSGPTQPVRQELPFFPRWCGPMQAAVWHSQQMSRPQFRPQFTMQQSGAYMPNRSMHQNPPVLQGTWPSQRFPPHNPVHKHNQYHQALHPSHHLNLVHSTLHKRPHQEAKENWKPPAPTALISILIRKRTKTTMTTRRSTA